MLGRCDLHCDGPSLPPDLTNCTAALAGAAQLLDSGNSPATGIHLFCVHRSQSNSGSKNNKPPLKKEDPPPVPCTSVVSSLHVSRQQISFNVQNSPGAASLVILLSVEYARAE